MAVHVITGTCTLSCQGNPHMQGCQTQSAQSGSSCFIARACCVCQGVNDSMQNTTCSFTAACPTLKQAAVLQYACTSVGLTSNRHARQLLGYSRYGSRAGSADPRLRAGRPRLPIIRKQQVAAAEVRGRVYNLTLPARREATAGCRVSSLTLPARRAATAGCRVFNLTLSGRRAATAAHSCTGAPPRGTPRAPRGALCRPPSLPALPSARAQTPMRGPPGLEPTLPLGRPAARAVTARQTAPST